MLSHPSRVRELKPLWGEKEARKGRSHPSRVRELKPCLSRRRSRVRGSYPSGCVDYTASIECVDKRGKEFGGGSLPLLGGNLSAFPEMGNATPLMKYSVIMRAKRILQRVSEGLNPLFFCPALYIRHRREKWRVLRSRIGPVSTRTEGRNLLTIEGGIGYLCCHNARITNSHDD